MVCYVTCKVLVVYSSFSSDGTYILKIVYELKHLSESFCLAFFFTPHFKSSYCFSIDCLKFVPVFCH